MDKKQEEKQEVTERIKTFEDAQRETGRPDVPEFDNMPEDLRDYFKAHYKMTVIAEALNEGWKADWSDENQRKWFPWLYILRGLRFRRCVLRSLECECG